MKNNDHDDRQNDHECLSPELAEFELQLKSLKPVAVIIAAGNVSDRLKTHPPRQTGHLFLLPQRKRSLLLFLASSAVILVVALTAALTYWQMQTPDHGNGQYIVDNDDPEPSGDPLQDVPEKTPDPTPLYASQQRQNGMSPDVFRGGLTMRKQLAMLLDEMQPTSTVAMEPKRPDYPVMIIPIRQDVPPLSPEAKQAFQRRLQRIDFEI